MGRRCAHPEGCNEASTRVVYGCLNDDARFCKNHRGLGHKDLSNKNKLCCFKGCLKYASFGQERSNLSANSEVSLQMFCKDHKPDGCNKRASYLAPGTRLWLQEGLKCLLWLTTPEPDVVPWFEPNRSHTTETELTTQNVGVPTTETQWTLTYTIASAKLNVRGGEFWVAPATPYAAPEGQCMALQKVVAVFISCLLVIPPSSQIECASSAPSTETHLTST
eukprot:767716-Hanusia_phi.AAC.4